MTHWMAAVSQAKRAASLLPGDRPDDEVARRARQLLLEVQAGENRVLARVVQQQRDREAVAGLEDVWLQKAALFDEAIDYADVDASYAQVFRDYWIDIETLELADAGDRIRRSPIAASLSAALDDWARGRRNKWGSDDVLWRQLLAIARYADQDDLRNRLRESLERGDPSVLPGLVPSDQIELLPTSTIVLLADGLVLRQTSILG